MAAKIIEQYKIEADNVKVDVQVKGGEGLIKTYNLAVPEIKQATLSLLDEIKDELIVEVQVTGKEILDPKVINKLKERFGKIAVVILEKKLPYMNDETKNLLVNKLVRDMLGLGDIEFLLNDTWLEEIVINSANEPVRVYHKKYGWLETNIKIQDEPQILNYSNIIARRVGRQITTLNPLLDAHLITGDRANAVLYPIASKGHTITIRKFARDPWTVIDFIENQTVTSEIMSMIWLGMQYEMNILVSGGTASGKTSLLNVILPFIPLNQRIITIEDTRELELPVYLYWVPLVTRLPNPEGRGEICMYPGSFFVNGDGELTEISEYVEKKLSKQSKRINKNIIAAEGDGDTVLAGDPLTLDYKREKIKAFTKNLNRKYICDVICNDGTKFSITENTKLPVLSKEGKINLLNPFEIKKSGGYLPLFTKININADIQNIKLFDIFDVKDIYACDIKNEYIVLENNLRSKFKLKELASRLGIKRQSLGYYRTTGIVNMYILKRMIELSDCSLDYFENKIKYLKGRGTTANLVKIPREVNEDLAYFAGFVLAEKFIGKNKIVISQKEDIAYILQNLVKNLFGLDIKCHKDEYNRYYILSSVVSHLMKQLFCADGAKNIRVSKIIMKSPENIIAAFLSGYIDGDGTVDYGRVALSSINGAIINEFKYLFTRLGVRSSIYSYKRMDRLNKIYTLNITARKDLQIACNLLRFRKKLNRKKANGTLKKQFEEGTIRNRIPVSWVIKYIQVFKNYLTKKERYNYYYRYIQDINKTISRDRLSKLVSLLSTRVNTTKEEENSLKILNELSKDDIEYVKIKDVKIKKNTRNIPSYDLTPENSKYFVAGNGNFTLVEDTMLDLLVNSLRMRPDRIILGEIRRKRDAEVLFESMHTGHSVYSTVHANTVAETIQRLINPPIEVHENLLQAVHLNVVMFRDRRRGIRRVFQVGEFLSSEEETQVKIKPNIIYRWKPGVDKIVQHGVSTKFYEEINRHTGLSDNEISKDMLEKRKILDWMVRNKIRQVNDVGKVMKEFYLDPDNVIKIVNRNGNPSELLR